MISIDELMEPGITLDNQLRLLVIYDNTFEIYSVPNTDRSKMTSTLTRSPRSYYRYYNKGPTGVQIIAIIDICYYDSQFISKGFNVDLTINGSHQCLTAMHVIR